MATEEAVRSREQALAQARADAETHRVELEELKGSSAELAADADAE
eukprot:COSAG01_NODE_77678_length_159_cov_266.733333_1_plen_45_part_10